MSVTPPSPRDRATSDAASRTSHARYDTVAPDYDRTWSVHVREPQQRLTDELRLRPGLRCVDLACGTGGDTLDMLQQTTPGEMVAVDCSRRMLDVAVQRAHAAKVPLTTRNESIDVFLESAPAESFDVVSLRFCLGYLQGDSAIERVARLLRPAGRVGILTILATSAPQAYATYEEMARQFGIGLVPRSGPPSRQDIEDQLARSGLVPSAAWNHGFRLSFETGESLAAFLRQTGLATHPLLDQLDQGVVQALWRRFAEGVESHRGADGRIPLDFELAGLVATRPDVA